MAANLRERAQHAANNDRSSPSAPNDPPPDHAPAVVPVHVALARVMADVRSVGKTDFHNSPTAKFHFRGIDAVVNAVGPALRRHGVIVLPEVQDVSYRDVTTSGGKASREVTVRVKYTFVGPDGSLLAVTVPGEAMDNGDKGTAKAMSVALRVALLQTLALPTDEPEVDSQAYQRERPQPTDAENAVTDLRTKSLERKLDLRKVAAAFESHYNSTIADAGADTVRAFTAALLADPEHVLSLNAPDAASNGSPA